MHYFTDLLGHNGGPKLDWGREDLRFYQHFMADQIKSLPEVYLAAEMGLGKTVSTLTAIADLFAQKRVRRVLIVAPLLVAEETWPDEIAKWSHTRHLTYSVITGTEKQRLAAMMGSRAQIHIINRENLVWLYKKVGDLWPYDMLVYDEASRLKQGKKRTAANKETGKKNLTAFGALARVRPLMKRAVMLSGTPSSNGLQDLWGPFYILDGGARLGLKRADFDSRWFDFDPYTYKTTPRPYAEAEIMGRISDIMFSLKEADYLELPERIDNPVYVTLPPKIMAAYKAFERELYIEEFDVEAVNSAVLTNKLLQYANGSLYNEDRDALFVHDLKLKALDSIIEEAAGEPILVAYAFQFDIAAMKKRYPWAVIAGEEKDWVARWNRGEIKMLIGHPASMGHGLNLQFGGSIGVWYGLTWSLELYQQFIKRLHRSGQRAGRVWMHHIIARGTADEDVMAAMRTKGATQNRITDAVRIRLEGSINARAQ